MSEGEDRTVTHSMFNPSPRDGSKESDADYYGRRAREEARASRLASSAAASDVHQALGLKYQRLADAENARLRRQGPEDRDSATAGAASGERSGPSER